MGAVRMMGAGSAVSICICLEPRETVPQPPVLVTGGLPLGNEWPDVGAGADPVGLVVDWSYEG